MCVSVSECVCYAGLCSKCPNSKPKVKSNCAGKRAKEAGNNNIRKKRRQPKICIQHKRDAVADAAEAGDGDGAVAQAVAVPGDGAVAVVAGVALMGSAGYWLPFVRSLGRLAALCLRLSALPTGHLSWQRTSNLTATTTTTRTVDKQSAAELSSWKDHFKQAPSAGYLSPAHGRVNLNI